MGPARALVSTQGDTREALCSGPYGDLDAERVLLESAATLRQMARAVRRSSRDGARTLTKAAESLEHQAKQAVVRQPTL